MGGGYKKIYAWEPDPANRVAVERTVKNLNDVVLVPCGLWSEKTVLSFRNGGDSASTFMNNDDDADVITVDVDSIDNVCSGDKVTFIKMDIEGSELEALKGAENVIRRDKPRLAICIYHKPEDLYEIPLWIKETVPEYKLYVRQHARWWTETVLYATL